MATINDQSQQLPVFRNKVFLITGNTEAEVLGKFYEIIGYVN